MRNAIELKTPAILTCAGFLALAFAISCFSGYRAVPIAPEIGWEFSPLGLAWQFHRDLFVFQTQPYFSGKFALTLDYWIVFLKTCACEAPFYLWAGRRLGLVRALALLLGANFATHPAVFFLFAYVSKTYLISALSAEAFAASAEMAITAWVLRRYNAGSPLVGALWVLGANLFSWQMGAIL